MSMASWTSPRVSARTLPISRVISFENSSLCCSSNSAARYKISARLGAGTKRQLLYASLAAPTAAFTSSELEETKLPTSSSVLAGLRFSYVLPLRASTHSPLIKFLKTRGDAAVAILPPQTRTPRANYVQDDIYNDSRFGVRWHTTEQDLHCSGRIAERSYCLLPAL